MPIKFVKQFVLNCKEKNKKELYQNWNGFACR